MSNRSINLTEQVYDYLLSVSLQESDVMRQCREETASHSMSKMQIAPEQGQFFQFLVKSLGVKQAIEVGVFTGYSSLAIATALPDDGKLIACDISTEYTDLAKGYWQTANVSNKIDLRIAPALETLQQLIDEGQAGQFDFAFVDAHKPEYIEYYELLLTLIKTGGVIAVDNVLWDGDVADPSNQKEDTVAIRAFNDHVFADKRVTMSLIPLADGITLIHKK